MSKTNCKNCGAALDIFAPKCEFCGTKNINLTELDLASGEAANFIFKLPNNMNVNGDIYMSMLAVPELQTITFSTDDVSICAPNGYSLMTYTRNKNIDMALNLRAVSRLDTNEICSLTIK